VAFCCTKNHAWYNDWVSNNHSHMQPTSQPKKTVPSFGKHIFAIGVALIIVLALIFMFSSRQGKSDLAAQLFPISIGPSSSNSVSLVCKSNSPISVKVTSPNGGQVYSEGQQITVTWSSCKVTGPVWIMLAHMSSQTTIFPGEIVSLVSNGQTANDGTETVTLPSLVASGWPTGNQYKVFVMNGPDPATASVKDYSDNYFTINYATQPGIIVGTTTGNGPTAQVTPGSPHDTVTFTIPFIVTALGSDVYVPKTASSSMVPTATNKIQFCVDATSPCSAVGNGVVSYLGSTSNILSPFGNYHIMQGHTESFRMTITYSPATTVITRASLLNVNWSTADATASGAWNMYTAVSNMNSFKTPYVSAQ
jgi:hypothetical protein